MFGGMKNEQGVVSMRTMGDRCQIMVDGEPCGPIMHFPSLTRGELVCVVMGVLNDHTGGDYCASVPRDLGEVRLSQLSRQPHAAHRSPF